MNITGLDLVCAITRRCHFFALAVGFVNPSSQLASLIGHAQHRTHTHPELARNAAALREQYAELLKLREEIRKLTSSRTMPVSSRRSLTLRRACLQHPLQCHALAKAEAEAGSARSPGRSFVQRTTLLLNSNVGSCHQSHEQPRCTDGSH
jgi:hypothetical protein